jgi:hypothetical protein
MDNKNFSNGSRIAQRTSGHVFIFTFPFLGVIFALLDPDPDSETLQKLTRKKKISSFEELNVKILVFGHQNHGYTVGPDLDSDP